jgi:hypothetical protein
MKPDARTFQDVAASSRWEFMTAEIVQEIYEAVLSHLPIEAAGLQGMRKAAIAKLTDSELQALGLDRNS